MVVFVLAPLVFAFGALLTEANALLVGDRCSRQEWNRRSALARPRATGRTMDGLPLARAELAHAGAISMWTQRTDPSALLGWAQSVGQFVGRHVFIILFAILMLFFLYQEGESLARNFRRLLRHHIGERAEGYVDLATRVVAASVNSMLVVALFDGFGTGVAYVIAGVPMQQSGPQSPACSRSSRSSDTSQ